MREEILNETAVKMAVMDITKKGSKIKVLEYMKTEEFFKSVKNYKTMLSKEFAM